MAAFDGSLATNTGIGQGLAYVLPQSRAEQYAAQLVKDESRQLAATAAAQLKRQQALQDSIGKQFSAQKLPAFWSPYNKIINDNNTAWQTKAVDYMSKTGKSPFTNPELMDERNRNVEAIAQQSKELGANYGKLYSAAVADAGNKFTPESVKQVLDAEQDIKANPMAYLDGSKRLPELKTQPASFNDFAKLIEPVSVSSDNGSLKTTRANRASHIDQALNTIISNPTKWGGMALQEFGLDLTKPTYPVVGQNGRKVYPTNVNTLNTLADQILAGQTAEAELAEFGIDVADEFAKEKLVDAMKKQNQGLGRLLTQTADLADAKVDTKSERVYDAERNARENARFRERNDGKTEDDVLYRRQWVQDMKNGVEGSGEKLKGIIGGMEGYDGEVKINTSTPNEIKIEVPARITTKVVDGKPKSVAVPKKEFTIKKNDPAFDSKMNSFLNDVTGEKISESKLMTGNAGGKIKTSQPKTSNKKTIKGF